MDMERSNNFYLFPLSLACVVRGYLVYLNAGLELHAPLPPGYLFEVH